MLANSTPSNEPEPMIAEQDTVGMEWAILNGSGWQAQYANRKVLYVTDIVCDEGYPGAINIVLEAGKELNSLP